MKDNDLSRLKLRTVRMKKKNLLFGFHATIQFGEKFGRNLRESLLRKKFCHSSHFSLSTKLSLSSSKCLQDTYIMYKHAYTIVYLLSYGRLLVACG